MKVACIGDNCIDVYPERRYATGNAVDTGVNIQKLGVDTAIISTTGDDANGAMMLRALRHEKIDLSHFYVGRGATAVTYMKLNGRDRVHERYEEGVLKTMTFSPEDLRFAASCDLVHTALWGKAENVLPELKRLGAVISFDYADRLDHPLVEQTLGCVDYGFYSYHGKDDSAIRAFLKDKVEHGMRIATATMGSNGSLSYDGKQFYTCGIVPANVENTVGAGDSFIAGFLVGLLQGKAIPTCQMQGARVASGVVSVFEPWQDYCDREETA